ncbi:MAG: CotH kinase family protein [Flavobacteriales bacterium]|nr:CotH kinase family protein [Flavobacteriales bacterium]
MKPLFILFQFLIITNIFSQTGGETCATATVIPSIPFTGIGNTSTATDDYYASCQDVGNPGGAKDLVYEFTNGTSDVYLDITLCQNITNYDSQLYIYEGSCTGAPINCQEDGCQSPNYGAPYNSAITAQLFLANTTYYIVVDGYDASSQGNYQIDIYPSVGISPPDSTNLPLVLFNTLGQEIVDEPKILLNMKIIHNGNTQMNHLNDFPNVYDGFAGVEIRGSYSSSLPQKPYGVETQDSLGQNLNVSLLNMPTENDWILIANYNDKTFLRNSLAFKLFTEMGHYAPRTQLCEVVINNIYNGIYLFTEKIKRDKGRVDIAKLKPNENAGDSLTGGYIFKVDYWDLNNSWPSAYNNPNYPSSTVRYVYSYPDEVDITNNQKNYIQTKVKAFEDDLWGSNFEDPLNGYRQHIDVTSFIDYFIVNEFARNEDGFKKSRYFHKDKNSNDSLIYAGPVWDFDWAYKDISSSMQNGAGWQHNYSGASDVKPPGWYIRMMQDSAFVNELACRYFNLRLTILDTTYLYNYIDSIAFEVNAAQERHYDRWQILGINVGTPEIGSQPTTYEGEITKFKSWISERLTWLDNNMPGNCTTVGIEKPKQLAPYWSIYPNPSRDLLNIYVDEEIKIIKIYDVSGRLIKTETSTSNNLCTVNVSNLSGIYFVEIQLTTGKKIQSKFVSQ